MGKSRKIVVDGMTYMWRFAPGYEKTGEAANRYRCHDIFTAYIHEYRHSPLQAHFITWEDPVIGGPLHMGAPINLYDSTSPRINLHEPKNAAKMIRLALQLGWQPANGKKPFVIENGQDILAELWNKAE
ncbi:MAG: hypothetical protein AB1757_09695 [Acidobacteriota bacterium]